MSQPPKPNTTADESPRPLAALAKEVGKPDPHLLAAFIAGTSDTALVEAGRKILSARVLTDAERLYGQAWEFWQQATTAQKKRLRGFSAPLLAVAVHQALELEALDAAHTEKKDDASKARAQGERAARRVLAEALALRDQAFDALRDAAAHDDASLAAVEAARGTVDDLPRGLDGLAGVLRAWLKEAKQDKALAGRLELGSLDNAFVDELESAAARARSAIAEADRRPAGGKVTQGQLDRADGINLLLLGQTIRAFEGAHELDPTIPLLAPIATRRLFSHKAKKASAPEAPHPTPEAAPPAA